jgi:hypothetical protein
MAFFVILLRVALVRTDVSEEHIASIIRLTSIGLLGRTLAVNQQPKHPAKDDGGPSFLRNIGSYESYMA